MKPVSNNKKLTVILAFGILVFAQSTFASEMVKWTGTVKEDSGYHTPGHTYGHDLTFVKQDDGESFDIVDSPELEKIHVQKDKNLLVEVEAEKTSQFLFWGGNLIVKNFTVVEELAEIPHHARPVVRTTFREGGGRR